MLFDLSKTVLDNGGGVVINTATPIFHTIRDFVVLCRLANVPYPATHAPKFWTDLLKEKPPEGLSLIEAAMQKLDAKVSFVSGLGGTLTREQFLCIEPAEDKEIPYAMDVRSLERVREILSRSENAPLFKLQNCEIHWALTSSANVKAWWAEAYERQQGTDVPAEVKLSRKTPPPNIEKTSALLVKLAYALPATAKVEALLAYIKAADGKVIVFAKQILACDYLVFFLKHSGLRAGCLHSGSSKPDKKLLPDRFKLPAAEEDAIDVLVLSLDYGNAGLNLQCAHRTVFMNLPTSEVADEQARGRTHRYGQTKKCEFVRFVPDQKLIPEEAKRERTKFKAYADIDTAIKKVVWAKKRLDIRAFTPADEPVVKETIDLTADEDNAEVVEEDEGEKDIEEIEREKLNTSVKAVREFFKVVKDEGAAAAEDEGAAAAGGEEEGAAARGTEPMDTTVRGMLQSLRL